MAYTPTEWKNGDVITAEKLNNIENGIVNIESEGVPIAIVDVVAAVDAGDYDAQSDATYEQLTSLFNEGKIVIAKVTTTSNTIEYAIMALQAEYGIYAKLSVTFGGGIIGVDATTGDWFFNRGNQ